VKNLTIILEDRPGTLAQVGETLGKAGVNIEGLCAFPCEGRGLVHLLVGNDKAAKDALENSSILVHEVREVFVFDKNKKQVVGKPGSFGEICRHLANHGININLAYAAENNRFVLGVDDLQKAQDIL
jgi:hypothetical protein